MKQPIHLWSPWLAIFILLLFGNVAQAGHIMLVPNVEIKVSHDFVDVNLVINNYGDEDSLDVSPMLYFGNQQIRLQEVPAIPVNNFKSWHHRFGRKVTGVTGNGIFPLLLRVNHHDINMYPYSMVEVAEVKIGELRELERGKKLSGKITQVEVYGQQKVTITLDNTFNKPLNGNFHLFLPSELTVPNPEGNFSLAAGESRQFDFIIHNYGALAGNRYKIIGVAQFAEQGINFSTIFNDMITTPKPALGTKKRSQVMGGAAFLILIFLIAVFMEMKSSQSGRHAA